MAPACWPCGRRAQKKNSGFCLPFCLGESCPPALAFMPETSVPPYMPLMPFKLLSWCWSSEGVWLSSLCVASLRGTAWDSRSFFHLLDPCWFLQSEGMGTYLPSTLTMGWGADMGLVLLSLSRYPSQIFIYHMRVWDQAIPCFCPSYQSGWM